MLCWGDNTRGQLGNGKLSTCWGSSCPAGTTSDSLTPVRVVGLDAAVPVAVAGHGSDFSCAVLADTSVRCWGSLTGVSSDALTTPSTVAGVSASARGLAVGYHHACAVSPAGDIQCWGDNGDGQLGDGTTSGYSGPTSVRGLATQALEVTAGLAHSCALLADASVQCWGDNQWGELGNGSFTSSAVPVTVSGISDAVAVSAGYLHTCALTQAGSVRCWGQNAVGQVGNGDTSRASVPTPVTVTGF